MRGIGFVGNVFKPESEYPGGLFSILQGFASVIN
jgi:hypothetical protein